MTDDVIVVEDLVKHYPPDIRAVDEISFKLRAGEIFSLLGPNGAGKTTTVEILEGLRTPTSGKATIFGIDVTEDYFDLRPRVGILPQNFEPFDLLKPWEALLYWARLYGFDPSRKDARNLLELVGLSERENLMAKKLSGGEKRKLGIALSLVNEPELLFLDEPTTGLDPKARRDLWNLIENIRDEGTTVFLTTHYLEEAEKLADEVAIMHRGKIIAKGSPGDLVNEYGKKTVVVFVGAGRRDADELRKLGFSATEEDGDVLVPISNGDETKRLFSEFVRLDIAAQDIYTKRETLEEVFLSLVGTQMEDGELKE